jgi:CRISPR-associated protein Csy1
MSKLKEKINNTKFGDEIKELRDKRKKNEYSEKTITEFPDLTIVGFGGTKPQNISIINNENHGEYYFLPSFPPSLDEDKVKTPARSFFNECLRYKYYAPELKAWQKLLKAQPNNINIREGRDKIIQNIFDDIFRRCFIIRTAEKGWSNQARCAELPEYEKILLDDYYAERRNEADDELLEFIKKAVRWLIKAFESINGKEAVKMFDEELKYYKDLIEEQAEVLLC